MGGAAAGCVRSPWKDIRGTVSGGYQLDPAPSLALPRCTTHTLGLHAGKSVYRFHAAA